MNTRSDQQNGKQILIQLLSRLETSQEKADFFKALFTPAEQETLAERIKIVEGLLSGKTHREIAKATGASLATISRGSREVKHGSGIFQKIFQIITSHRCGNLDIFAHRKSIPMRDAADIHSMLKQQAIPSFLFESRSVNTLYGRMSLIGIDPALRLCGKGNQVTISVCNDRGKAYLADFLASGILDQADRVIKNDETGITLEIIKDESFLPEDRRTQRRNITLVLRQLLAHFATDKKLFLGIYGTFSYDFARLFESLPDLHSDEGVPDFQFFLFDTFVRFDLLKEQSEIICYRSSAVEAMQDAENIDRQIRIARLGEPEQFATGKIDCDTDAAEFQQQVETAKDLAKRGETFEVVFSRKLHGKFSGDAFGLYRIYREKNPAPYLFYFDFGEDQLVGASPEMMVRVEDGNAHLRPISGTRPRGKDPIADHQNELELLNCPKERAELDMLIDLGRNDLKRVCQAGIEIVSYRHVEKYSRVMHTIAHLTGKLDPRYTALDALIACQSAGTLTGAPKVQAMIEIEKTEKSRRGLYGGSVGYLTFSGEMDTGIIIRSAHIHDGIFEFRTGATLLYDSVPEDERKETDNKARALLEILKSGSVSDSGE